MRTFSAGPQPSATFFGRLQYGSTFWRSAIWRYSFAGKRYLVFRRYFFGGLAIWRDFFGGKRYLVFRRDRLRRLAGPRIMAGSRLVADPPTVGGKRRREKSRHTPWKIQNASKGIHAIQIANTKIDHPRPTTRSQSPGSTIEKMLQYHRSIILLRILKHSLLNSSAIRRKGPLHQYGRQRRLTTIFILHHHRRHPSSRNPMPPLVVKRPIFVSPQIKPQDTKCRHGARITPRKIEKTPGMMKLVSLQNFVNMQPRHCSAQVRVNHSIEQNPQGNQH